MWTLQAVSSISFDKQWTRQKLFLVFVLVKLIGVNKGRQVTLKYFSILIKVSRKHRLFIGESLFLGF